MLDTKKEKYEDRVVRVLSTDIEGKMSVYSGLTKVKGISWAVSNAICHKLNIPRNKKIGQLTQEEIQKIEKLMKSLDIPVFLKNRQKDFETGESTHIITTNLELTKEFDIKRLKKIKSYRGIRHTLGLPLRGQRTRSHFRKNRAKGVGIKKKKK